MRRISYAAAAATAATFLGTLSAKAQDAEASIDQTVNQLFADSTGWFVSFIFSPFPGTSFPWIVAWLVVG